MKPLIARLRARLQGRPDTEHEQAVVRLVIGSLLFFYLLPGAFQEGGAAGGPNYQYLLAMIGYLVLAAVIFVDILARPGISRSRRVLGAIADTGAITYFMGQTGAHGAPLFLVYLWITLANGFRFGRRYLLISLALSTAGFLLVLAASPFWQANLRMGIGLLVGLVAISVYVLSLVNRMFDAIARAEAANHAKRRFISMVSHEMRTPLNAVIGMADLLQTSPLDREQQEMVRTIGSSSRVLLGLVEDVLDFSKIEAGKLTISVTDFDLHALVNSVSRIFAPQASAKNLDFHVVIMPDVPHALRGDAHYIRQVIINLTSNALKFTEAGSVTVHVAKVAESDERVALKFSVRDTGIGIAPENQARIFESFTQADDSTTRRFGGTGLGTTISKQLVELMGGKIGVESAVGLGSTFWFELELGKQAESAPGAEQGAQAIAGSRVLIVGPEEGARAIGALLEGWGTGWVSVPGPDTAATVMAVEAKRGLPFRMALIQAESLRQGEAILGRLRRSPDLGAIPAILLVPRGMAGAQDPAASCDFKAVLETPVDKRLLFNALHAIAADEPQQGVVALRDYLKRKETLPSYRVLLVDDNATNRAVVGKILERAGHAVVAVSSGDEALDAVEEQRFDLVILDRNMPGMSGVETAQALRLMQLGQGRVPVVMLSADATAEARAEALEAGVDEYLAKPVQAGRLLEVVDQLCGRRAAETPAAPTARVAPARSAAPVLNLETISLLEGLGSAQSDFIARLVKVFIEENAALVDAVRESVAAKRIGDLRAQLHALKGSAASIGADRLAAHCSRMHAAPEGELRLRGVAWAAELADEFEAARAALTDYIESRASRAARSE